MNYVTEPRCGNAKTRGRFAPGFARLLERAVALAAGGFVALALAPAAPAQEKWPVRPIRMIVPFPPGSSPDLIARVLTDRLGAALGQPVVVENRPGAGGMVGTGQVAKAAPDGYTIGLSIPGPLAVNTVLMKSMEYDPFKELAPITVVAASPNVLVVDARLGVNDVSDFVKLARSQPGKLNFGSVGNGSASHLTMELLKQRAGLDLVHVPYPGSPQVNTAILHGQIAAAFVVPATAMPLVQAGRLKALGATTTSRSVVLPDTPTIAEQGFAGFESTAWIGAVAPAKTPPPIVDRLSEELVRIIRSDDVRQRMIAIYFQPVGTAPEALRILMRGEADRWGKVIKAAGVKPG
jgi:tripartite-type tricarboxylate transporter receptor subunit TctC